MSTKESRARALERIKAAKEGRAVQMELSDSEEDIIEDVSEDEYDRRKKASVLDDFVVDDDGRGYAEDGRDWWEHDDDVGSQTDSDEDAKRSKTDKRKNRKDKKEKKKKDPNQRSINKLFSAMGAKAAKTAAATPAVDTVAVPSDDFLSGLLSDLNEDPLAKKAGRYAHRNKSSGKKTAADIALMGSTSAANELYDKPAQTNEAINLSADHGSDDEEELTSRYQKRMEAIREKRERDASARAKAEVTAPTAVKAEEMLQDFDTDEPGSSSPSLNTVKSEAKAEPVAKAVPAAAKKVPTAVKREIKVRDFDEDPDEEDIELESAAINNDQDWWQIRSETVQKEKLEAQQREKEEEERREKERNIMATNEQGVRKAFVNIATLAPSQSANLPTVTVKAASVQKADASDEEMDTAEPETEEQEEVFRFFYMDIVEEPYKKPGTVFVIGKVWNPSTEEFESACCTVRDIERNLFVLPRDVEVDNKGNATDRQVSFQSVYKEFDSVMERYGVLKWEASMVTRSYAFEYADVPSSAEYLKVKYPMTSQQLPMDLSGRTFARVFGTNTNASELFLLKRKLMGPSWLDVKGFKRSGSQLSWCKWEIEVNGYKSIAKTTDPPPVPVCRLAAISLKTVLSKKTHKHEIVGISVITHKAVNIEGQTENPEADFESFSVIRPLANSPFPFDFESTVKQQQLNITCANNERALLSLFIAKFHKLDPDFIVGHNLFNFDLDILLHRMQDCKVTQWSKMGRMRRTVMPKLSGGNDGGGSYGEKLVIGGRLGVCMWTSARELIKVQTYSLEELASTQLGKERHRLEFDQIPNMYGATTNLVQLMRHCENDAYLIVSLMFKIMSLPLSRQITTLAGNLWARTLSGGRAERSEYLLLHEFHDRKYVLPDKHKSKKWTNKEDENEDDKSKTHPRRKKAQYAGGLVLEPRKGFYDTFILLLDFNSLYPSIIQEYNVCFTTVAKPTTAEEENAIPDVPDSGLEQGVLPYVLATLIERRKQVKNLIKTERNKAKLTQLNIRQLAFKLTANSMYGCLGFSHSRFYAKPLAALVTSKGREILENTVTLARTSLNLDVIYGDTDSIMVNTNKKDLKEVMEIGRKVCKEVNKLYRLLEIDIDGVYKSMLLLKKKKYAALAIHEKDGKFTTVQETKGLDIVRRDWCGLSHDVGSDVLKLILSDDVTGEDLANSIHNLLREVGEKVKNNEIPVEKYIINKGLTKNPEDYPDKKNQPHVQVALRMKARGQAVQAKDTIPFVICVDDNSKSLSDRAHHPDDLAKDDSLVIDATYYLKQQIHPVVTRLCDPIQGTDTRMIAECLGLDASSYHVKQEQEEEDELIYKRTQISDAEKYRDADGLSVKCPSCGTANEITGIFSGDISSMGEDVRCAMACVSCAKAMPPAFLCNTLTLLIRAAITKYYQGWLLCDEQACRNRTRYVSVCGRRCSVPYCRGTMSPEYSAHQLFTQLAYYQYLFDLPLLLKKSPSAATSAGNNAMSRDGVERITSSFKDDISRVHAHVTTFIQKNARTYVDLAQLFGSLTMAINAPKMAPGAH